MDQHNSEIPKARTTCNSDIRLVGRRVFLKQITHSIIAGGVLIGVLSPQSAKADNHPCSNDSCNIDQCGINACDVSDTCTTNICVSSNSCATNTCSVSDTC